jgi:hypothetical protein
MKKYLLPLLFLTNVYAQDFRTSYQEYAQAQTANRMEIVHLNAFLDLSHLDPTLARILERHFEEAQRQNRVREFWAEVFMGQQKASQYIEQAGTINPKVCDVIQTMNQGSAMGLGVRMAAPFCFLPNYFAKLKEISSSLTGLKKDLLKIKLKMSSLVLDEVQEEELLNEIQDEMKKSYLGQLTVSKATLENALALDEELVAKVNEAAETLSLYINCPNLVSRTGERFICGAKIIPSPLKLTLGDAYKIIYKNKQTGAFQASIYISGLMKAASTYLNEVRPNDQLINLFVSNLKRSLEDLDYSLDIKLKKIIESSRQNLEDKLLRDSIYRKVALRKLLQSEGVDNTITKLYGFKLSVQDYLLWDVAHEKEKVLVEKLSFNYNEVVSTIGSIEASLNLRLKDVLIDLGEDEEQIKITNSTVIGPVYYLGINQAQVNSWVEFLSLK